MKSHCRGKTKLVNLFRKKKGQLVLFQSSKNAENKKNHPFQEYKDETNVNKSKNKH